MRSKLIIGGIVILIIGVVLGSYWSEGIVLKNASGYIPKLLILGDVTDVLEITGLAEYDREVFKYKDEVFSGVKLKDLVNRAGPVPENYLIQLTGNDGLTAQFSGQKLAGCYVTFTDKYGWEAINLNHPVSSNIKNLQEITVISEDSDYDVGLSLFTPEKNLLNITPGQALADTYGEYLKFEGSSQLEHEGINYRTTIFTRRRVLQIENLLPKDTNGRILIIGRAGEMINHQEGFLEITGNRFDYLAPTKKIEVQDVQGVLINPPVYSITDTYYDTVYYLESDQRVMVIYIDGFGYHQYRYAVDHGLLPFLGTLNPAKQALAVFQPVTNAGMAAMITGVGPVDNGVNSRAQKDMLVEDFFTVAAKTGKKSMLIEGDIKVLNTGVEPTLNIDLNNNGTRDDEIFATAKSNLQSDISLMLVHFHGVDDQGSEYGDLANETLEFISLIDSYIAQLVAGWSGKVIVTADHGLHKTSEGGVHGFARYEDMIVPYIITEGGQTNE